MSTHEHGPLIYVSGGGSVVIGIIIVIWAWIIGIQMRRKIRKDLGRKATKQDLTSIETWMKVDEVEEQNRRNNPLEPK